MYTRHEVYASYYFYAITIQLRTPPNILCFSIVYYAYTTVYVLNTIQLRSISLPSAQRIFDDQNIP